ncbi:M1 family metallopeptidase [Hymenobacter sp. BT175]|uniref:M1 family metallopeptidase n=1 Tax=Hymenobacter translucens TaxID=2886507 RepID=UPI001D0F2E3E|nr:M1 family metallopeptidase [Hymenobacter translucens]MCC2546935.1 M1 family metallopeptidase [Hymenobacter translucens]
MKKLLVGLWLTALPLVSIAQAARPAGYWQQEVNYSIDVALDDQQHMLTAKEELQYTNNSPDQLTFIWFHLWPNAYRDNSTAFARQQRRNGSLKFEFAKDSQRGFIDQLDFKVDGQAAQLALDPANPDMAKLILPQPLAPGGKITITTPFRVKLPDSFSRMGHVGQSYQITQWYPKPAVYDRKGWHPMPYLDQGEFFSEFGSFDVRITLPANYVVGATGELQNPDERARMDQLAEAGAKKKTADDFGTAVTFPASAAETKTLRYTQDRVHDFAWFADKRFNVLKGGVTLASGRQVTSWVLFTNKDAEKWIKGLQDVNDAITYYSKWVGEYPYSAATAVDGALSAGSGMEYPMVTVTEPEAIVHEVGHNWFYGILASNERDYAWQDEGVNSYLENRIAERDDPYAGQFGAVLKNDKVARAFGLSGLTATAINQVPYQAVAGRGLDQPVSGVASAHYGKLNYGIIVYTKTASLLKYLAGYLGQDTFDKAMHLYFDRWKFKHPYPEDMQAVFEEASGQQLDWFFTDMLTTQNRYDAALSDMQVTDTQVKVLVHNESPAPFAVPVSTVDAQGKVLQTLWTPVFGRTDEDLDTQLDFRREGVAAVVVDAEYLTPQLNRRNDRMKVTGAFRKFEPIQIKPLASVERWDRGTLNYLPVLGANTSDKFMLGAAFYNSPLITRRFNFVVMPMYSFSRNELNGSATLKLNILPSQYSRLIVTSATVQRYERYRKVEPAITFRFPHDAFDAPQHLLRLANTAIRSDDTKLTTSIQTVEYQVRGGHARQKWGAHVEFNQLTPDLSVENFSEQGRMIRAAANYEFFYSPKSSVRVRLFGGRFLQDENQAPFVIGLSGSPDYRRQTAFLDRQQISQTFTAQLHQTDNRDGAFKAYMPVGSTRWLSTLNLEATIPYTSYSVFADFGATKEKFTVAAGRNPQRLYYDAGLSFPLIKNVVSIYLPVAGSQYSNGLPSNFKNFTDQVRFVLRLDQLNPFTLMDEQLGQ